MALTETPVVGQECKLYRNTATEASPTWVEITHAINVSANLGKGEADVSARFSGWKLTRGALKELEITFTYRKKQGTDTVFTALIAAVVARTAIQLAVLDAAITEVGAQGPKAYCELFSSNLSQDLESAEEVEFTAKPTYFEESSVLIEPEWHLTPTP